MEEAPCLVAILRLSAGLSPPVSPPSSLRMPFRAEALKIIACGVLPWDQSSRPCCMLVRLLSHPEHLRVGHG